MRLRHRALILLAGMPAAAFAQTCAPPHPFDRTSAIGGTVAFVETGGATCGISSTLAPDYSTASGAFAWYSVPELASTFRIAFRVDTSQLAADGVLDGVQVLAVTSRNTASGAGGNVLHVGLVGALEGPTAPYVAYFGSCGVTYDPSCATDPFFGELGPIANGDRLGFEVGIGAGAGGWFRFWLNADFSDPPTYEVDNLDNGALLGPGDVALGAFAMTASLATTGTAVRIFDIETFDDVIAWSDFDD